MCVRIAVQNPPFVPAMYLEPDGAAYLDIGDDFSLRFSKRLEELTDINTIKTDSVLGFSVPSTPKNDVILGSALSPNRVDNTFTGFPVIIYMGTHIISQKTLFPVQRNSDEYEIEVRNSVQHWAVLAKDLNLNTLKLRDEPFEFTNNNINDTNDLGPYTDGGEILRFPVAYYGQFTDKRIIPPLKYIQHIGVSDFRPYFSILGILQKAFCSIGWTFRSSILESDYGRRLITYILDKEFGTDEATADSRDLRLELGSNIPFIAGINYTPITYTAITDPSGGWSSADYRYRTAGIYDIKGNLRIRVKKNENTLSMALFIGKRVIYMYTKICFDLPNGENYGLENIELGFTLNDLAYGSEDIILDLKINRTNFQLDPGSALYFTINCDETAITVNNAADIIIEKDGTYIDVNCTKVFIEDGDTLEVNSLIDSSYNLLDFVKGVAHLFAGKFHTDYLTNTVYLYPTYNTTIFGNEDVEGFFNDQDFDDYTDLGQEKSEVVNALEPELNRYYLLKFKGEGDEAIKLLDLPEDKPFLSYKIDFGDSVLNTEVKELENPFFEATTNLEYSSTDSPVPINMPHMLDNAGENGKYALSYKIGPRVLYWAGKQEHFIMTPNGIRNTPLRIFGQNAANIPTAYQWTDTRFTGFSFSEYNVAYGEHITARRPETTDKDLYNFFYQKWLAESVFNLTINILLFLEQARYIGIDFRKTVLIRAFGRDIFGRLLEVNDYNSCRDLSTPVTFMPHRQVSDDCNPLPDGGGDNGNTTCKQNQPLLIVERDGDCYDFSLGGSSESTIDTVTFEWQYPGGPWTAATSLCNPENAFTVRMTVTYSDGCPQIIRTVYVDACGNSPVLFPEWDAENGCFTISIQGVIVSEIDEGNTLIDYSLDSGDTWASYTGDCVEVGEAQEILLYAVISYTDGCASSEIESSFEVPIPSNCNLTDADVECDDDGIITLTGTVYGTDALDIVRYRPVGQDYWFIWDGLMRILPQPIEYQRIIIFCNNSCPTYCTDIYTWEGA